MHKLKIADTFVKFKNLMTFKSGIAPCVANLDSGVGVYAPDAESYTVFADLFNPVIEDYHGGFKSTDRQPPTDFGDLSTLLNVDPDNKYVVSTRVRCGRSLQGYPFNPCLTEAQYKEMEEKVSSALKGLTGELKGIYYPLTGMDKKTQQQLIDDHFLFKEGDRFLQAANACRYWPTGRGIFHNDKETFLVWVNEEDHLRIISMQQGGDLKQVYSRMVNGVKEIEKKLPFSRDDRLGFLTFCPTNLGTTIRASVHIKLPKLAADKSKLDSVAAKYNLQVRGTDGEHTDAIGGMYDISNKRRLGLTEYQAVRTMQDGVIALIKIEKDLQQKADADKAAAAAAAAPPSPSAAPGAATATAPPPAHDAAASSTAPPPHAAAGSPAAPPPAHDPAAPPAPGAAASPAAPPPGTAAPRPPAPPAGAPASPAGAPAPRPPAPPGGSPAPVAGAPAPRPPAPPGGSPAPVAGAPAPRPPAPPAGAPAPPAGALAPRPPAPGSSPRPAAPAPPPGASTGGGAPPRPPPRA
ncbi:hypothetical protein MTO96_031186 [Rhipicephalus appendiculatus]